ncbi:hypothetical protein ZIOFF_074752 [Zingiber officinale]|uniref:Uncharacterized protein n=1 Tax=Zingiber officinale TaxID=94328 RepID=A0A8J5ERY3_ZINOF|nr:hypothetical protein ZIOFF_074752 [Zingiber officinale]
MRERERDVALERGRAVVGDGAWAGALEAADAREAAVAASALETTPVLGLLARAADKRRGRRGCRRCWIRRDSIVNARSPQEVGYTLGNADGAAMVASQLSVPTIFAGFSIHLAMQMELQWLLLSCLLTYKYAHIHTLRGRILETILSCRFFFFQYGIVYKLHASGSDTSITDGVWLSKLVFDFWDNVGWHVYAWSWIVFAGLVILFQVFTFGHKAWVNFQLPLRLIQSVTLLLLLAGLAAAIVLTALSVTDILACILAFIPTGWAIISIAVAWKPVLKKLRIWKSVRTLARLYDAGMGMFIIVPIAMFSWLPFVSTFQTRLLFNQAFSRGLEISLILSGNNQNNG